MSDLGQNPDVAPKAYAARQLEFVQAVEEIDEIVNRGAFDAKTPRKVDDGAKLPRKAVGFDTLINDEPRVAAKREHRHRP